MEESEFKKRMQHIGFDGRIPMMNREVILEEVEEMINEAAKEFPINDVECTATGPVCSPEMETLRETAKWFVKWFSERKIVLKEG